MHVPPRPSARRRPASAAPILRPAFVHQNAVYVSTVVTPALEPSGAPTDELIDSAATLKARSSHADPPLRQKHPLLGLEASLQPTVTLNDQEDQSLRDNPENHAPATVPLSYAIAHPPSESVVRRPGPGVGMTEWSVVEHSPEAVAALVEGRKHVPLLTIRPLLGRYERRIESKQKPTISRDLEVAKSQYVAVMRTQRQQEVVDEHTRRLYQSRTRGLDYVNENENAESIPNASVEGDVSACRRVDQKRTNNPLSLVHRRPVSAINPKDHSKQVVSNISIEHTKTTPSYHPMSPIAPPQRRGKLAIPRPKSAPSVPFVSPSAPGLAASLAKLDEPDPSTTCTPSTADAGERGYFRFPTSPPQPSLFALSLDATETAPPGTLLRMASHQLKVSREARQAHAASMFITKVNAKVMAQHIKLGIDDGGCPPVVHGGNEKVKSGREDQGGRRQSNIHQGLDSRRVSRASASTTDDGRYVKSEGISDIAKHLLIDTSRLTAEQTRDLLIRAVRDASPDKAWEMIERAKLVSMRLSECKVYPCPGCGKDGTDDETKRPYHNASCHRVTTVNAVRDEELFRRAKSMHMPRKTHVYTRMEDRKKVKELLREWESDDDEEDEDEGSEDEGTNVRRSRRIRNSQRASDHDATLDESDNDIRATYVQTSWKRYYKDNPSWSKSMGYTGGSVYVPQHPSLGQGVSHAGSGHGNDQRNGEDVPTNPWSAEEKGDSRRFQVAQTTTFPLPQFNQPPASTLPSPEHAKRSELSHYNKALSSITPNLLPSSVALFELLHRTNKTDPSRVHTALLLPSQRTLKDAVESGANTSAVNSDQQGWTVSVNNPTFMSNHRESNTFGPGISVSRPSQKQVIVDTARTLRSKVEERCEVKGLAKDLLTIRLQTLEKLAEEEQRAHQEYMANAAGRQAELRSLIDSTTKRE